MKGCAKVAYALTVCSSRERIFQSLLTLSWDIQSLNGHKHRPTKLSYNMREKNVGGKTSAIITPRGYPTIVVALVSWLVFDPEDMDSLVLVFNIFVFLVALSDHDIHIASFSGADSFHISCDRSLRLWMSLPSL